MLFDLKTAFMSASLLLQLHETVVGGNGRRQSLLANQSFTLHALESLGNAWRVQRRQETHLHADRLTGDVIARGVNLN